MYVPYVSLGNLFGNNVGDVIEKMLNAGYHMKALSDYTELELSARMTETEKGLFLSLNMYGHVPSQYIFVPKSIDTIMVTEDPKGVRDLKILNSFEIRPDANGTKYFHAIPNPNLNYEWEHVFFDLTTWSGDKTFVPLSYADISVYEWELRSKGKGAGVRFSVIPWNRKDDFTTSSSKCKELDKLIIHD